MLLLIYWYHWVLPTTLRGWQHLRQRYKKPFYVAHQTIQSRIFRRPKKKSNFKYATATLLDAHFGQEDDARHNRPTISVSIQKNKTIYDDNLWNGRCHTCSVTLLMFLPVSSVIWNNDVNDTGGSFFTGSNFFTASLLSTLKMLPFVVISSTLWPTWF